MDLMDEGQFFAAAKKFSEAELIMPKFEQSAKASILSSYCYYRINFYDESLQNLDTFVSKYTADTHLQYAYYLSAIISFEQIVDEKKDLSPLIETKKKSCFHKRQMLKFVIVVMSCVTWISQTCELLMYLDIGEAPGYLRRMKNLVDSFLS